MPGPIARNQSRSDVLSDLATFSRLRPDQELRARNNRTLGIVEIYTRPKSTGWKKTFQNIFSGRKQKLERARREIERAFPDRADAIASANPRTARDYFLTVAPAPELGTLSKSSNQDFLQDFLSYLNTDNRAKERGILAEVDFQLAALKLDSASDAQACEFLGKTMPRLFGEDDPYTEIDPRVSKLNVDTLISLQVWQSLGLPLDQEVRLLKDKDIKTDFMDHKARSAFQKQLAGYGWDELAKSEPPRFTAEQVRTALAPVTSNLLLQLLRNEGVKAEYQNYKNRLTQERRPPERS